MARVREKVLAGIDRCARALIWYMLSNNIFANGSLTTCLHLLGPLRDFKRIPHFDWGSAGPVACYHGMDKACQDSNALEGFRIIIEIRSSPKLSISFPFFFSFFLL